MSNALEGKTATSLPCGGRSGNVGRHVATGSLTPLNGGTFCPGARLREGSRQLKRWRTPSNSPGTPTFEPPSKKDAVPSNIDLFAMEIGSVDGQKQELCKMPPTGVQKMEIGVQVSDRETRSAWTQTRSLVFPQTLSHCHDVVSKDHPDPAHLHANCLLFNENDSAKQQQQQQRFWKDLSQLALLLTKI